MFYRIASIIIIILVIGVIIATCIDNRRYQDENFFVETLYSNVEAYHKQKIQREEVDKLIKESKYKRLDIEILIYKINKDLEESGYK